MTQTYANLVLFQLSTLHLLSHQFHLRSPLTHPPCRMQFSGASESTEMNGGGFLSPPRGGAVRAVSVAAGCPSVKLAAEAGSKPATLEQNSSSASAWASPRSLAATSSAAAPAAAAAASSCQSFPRLRCGRKESGSEFSGGSQVEKEEEKVNGVKMLSLRSVFELVPSVEEAEAAIDALKQTFSPSASHDIYESIYSIFGVEDVDKQLAKSGGQQEAVSTRKDLVMRAPSPQLHHRTFNNMNKLSQVQKNILNLPSLLHINPALQRMVMSLASDKSVWDAVMKNDTVQELKKSFLAASGLDEYSASGKSNGLASTASACSKHKTDEENSDIAKLILPWILDNIKSTLSELIDKIILLVNKVLLQNAEQEKTTDILVDITKSSLKLTLMVFIVVVIGRIKQI